jgi:hypothetical protein
MSTTYSGPIRVGKKPFAAGTLLAQLAVSTDTAEVGKLVATLPPGSSIQSVMSDAVGVALQFNEVGGPGTYKSAPITTVGEPVWTGVSISDFPISVTVDVGAADSIAYITYKPYDKRSGANG